MKLGVKISFHCSMSSFVINGYDSHCKHFLEDLPFWTALLETSHGFLLPTHSFRVSKATGNVSETSVSSLIVT